MFLNQITEGLRDPKDNPCWKGYHPVGTKKKNGRTVPNCVPESQEGVNEGAYEDGVSDGIRGTPNRRASSIYGPSTGEYDRGYQVGLQKGKEQQQARLAQAQQDSAPYEKMSDEELIQLRKDIQQRSTERQKIYSKLRGADFSFDPKRHLPANDAELKAQHAKDNKAWHIINQVLQQRGVNINKLGESEGAEFGSIYAEQLAQQTFDIKPDLKDENEVLNLGYSIAMRELGPRARGFFRDEDFPSDFVSAYGWLQDQKQGVEEDSNVPHWRVEQSKATGRYYVVTGYTDKSRRVWKSKQGAGDFNKKENAEAKAQELNQGVAEGASNIGQQIKAAYQKIYNAGDDAVEFMYYDSPIFAQYWDEYEGDLDSIIAEVDPNELQIILDELQSAVEDQGLAEGSNDTVYPNAEVIKSKNGKPVGEIYQDGNGWGCFHYRADRGYDTIDSREDAIQALKDIHSETGRSRPDYTIKGVAEAKADPTSTWVVYDGDKVKRFKTHQGAKAYAEQHGGKVASSAHYADKIQGKQGVAEGSEDNRPWTNKEEEKLRRSVAGLDSMFGKDDAWTKTKQKQIKQQIKTKPMAGPKGQLPEQGVVEGANDQVYTIDITRERMMGPSSTRSTSGTLAELIEYFGYTLEVGKSYEHERGRYKINMNPKNIQSLVDNLNKAQTNAAANGNPSTYYSVSEKGVAEGDYDIRRDPTYQKYNPETHTMMYKDGKHKAVKHDQVAKAKSLGWKVRSSLKAFAKGQSVAEGDKNKEANYDKKYQDMVQRAGQSVKNIEKKFGPVDIKSLAQRLNDIEQGKK